MPLQPTAYGYLFQEHHGRGQIAFPNTDVEMDCTFSLMQMEDGACVLHCTSLLPVDDLGEAWLRGQTQSGASIEARIYAGQMVRLDVNAADISDHVALRVRSVDIGESGACDHWVYSLTNDLSPRRDLRFVHAKGTATVQPLADFADRVRVVTGTGAVIVTSELSVEADTRDDADEVTRYVCLLLSIATATRVQWINRRSIRNGREVSRHFGAKVTKRYTGAPAVRPERLQPFMTECLPLVSEVDDRWRLQELVGLWMDSRPSPDFLEVRAVKTAIVVEAINAQFLKATQRTGFIRDPDEFDRMKKKMERAIKPLLKEAAWSNDERQAAYSALAGLNRWSFPCTLAQVFSDVGATFDDTDLQRFVEVRNSLVHRGTFHIERHLWSREYFWMQSVVSRLILRIVGFTGPCVDSTDTEAGARRILMP